MSKLIDVTHEDPVLRTFMLFMQIGQAAYKYSDNRLSQNSEVSAPVFVALKALIMSGGTMSHTELAQWTNTRLNTITGLVDRMTRDGLVSVKRSVKDRRLVHVKITAKGRKAFAHASPVSREIMERLMRGIDGKNAAQFEALLNVMKANLEESP